MDSGNRNRRQPDYLTATRQLTCAKRHRVSWGEPQIELQMLSLLLSDHRIALYTVDNLYSIELYTDKARFVNPTYRPYSSLI